MITEDWGLIRYDEAVEKQLGYVEKVRQGHEGFLILCTHPPIVTVGRGTQDDDVFDWQGEIYEASRGGRATFHGPNQIIAYPIINLATGRAAVPARDLHAYMRALEAAIIDTLKEYGIQGERRKPEPESTASYTGVWIGEKKIASIGIAAKSWVVYHGLALNVEDDPRAFTGINPCGFKTETMISMESILARKISRTELTGRLERQLRRTLAPAE